MINREGTSALGNLASSTQLGRTASNALVIPEAALVVFPAPELTLEERAAEIKRNGIARTLLQQKGHLNPFDTKAMAMHLKETFQLESVEVERAGVILVSKEDCLKYSQIMNQVEREFDAMKGWKQSREFIRAANTEFLEAQLGAHEIVVTNSENEFMSFKAKTVGRGEAPNDSEYSVILEMRQKRVEMPDED